MEFGEKLKKLRREKGLSQRELADRIFVSRSAVAKWENGLGLPSEDAREALMNCFGVQKEFFETEKSETVILQKNRTIRQRSISLSTVITLGIVILIAYLLYRPVPYFASAGCGRIYAMPIMEGMRGFEITEEDKREEFIDRVNATQFRKSLRMSNEAPDGLRATFLMEGSGDIWLCETVYGHRYLYLWTRDGELIACDPDPLWEYLLEVLERGQTP